MTNEHISILGDGNWGTTLAIFFHKKGHTVTLWSPFKDHARHMRKTRMNKKFLPNVRIDPGIDITDDLRRSIATSRYIILAIPSPYLRAVLKRIKALKSDLKNKIVVSVVKGIETRTLKTASCMIKEELGNISCGVLAGPTIAKEVLSGYPSAAIAASVKLSVAKKIQDLFSSKTFRVYTNTDVTGVELGGCVKNTLAIACGLSDGMGFGANTKAALITRGLKEMERFGTSLGGRKKTFQGISGLGDLITTCFSSLSRNRRAGEAIGRGQKVSDILKNSPMIAEGIPTAQSIEKLSRHHKIEMPICHEVYLLLYKNKSPRDILLSLMLRDKKSE